MSEYRVYNKLNCNLFDLIGNKEPDQTKGLGFLLAKSDIALELLLALLFPNDKKSVKELLSLRRVVDCELIQQLKNNQSYRADVVIRFYDDLVPYAAIVIEAKASNVQTRSSIAAGQLLNYCKSFKELVPFGNNVFLVTLTNVIDLDRTVPFILSITWQQIRDMYGAYRDSKAGEKQLIGEYFDYLNKISGTMEYYDVEVLSVPAGRTINYVRDEHCGIYECPVDGRQYKARGLKRPLYMTFRENNKHGRMTDLYKIQDILSFDLHDQSAIDAVSSMMVDGSPKYPNIRDRIEFYKNGTGVGPGKKWVFIIDLNSTIHLPTPVEYEGSIRGLAGNDFLSLKDLIQTPVSGQSVVKIKMKKDR